MADDETSRKERAMARYRRYSGFSGRRSGVQLGHGSWKNDSCFARVSKNWKPDYRTLHQSHACPNPWGPQGPGRPPNITDDPKGWNTRMWRTRGDVVEALQLLGYQNGNMLHRFQQNWNRVSMTISRSPDRYASVPFAVKPSGLIRIDGEPGTDTVNALEIAIINQRSHPELAWPNIIRMVMSGDGYGRRKRYNAAQGSWKYAEKIQKY